MSWLAGQPGLATCPQYSSTQSSWPSISLLRRPQGEPLTHPPPPPPPAFGTCLPHGPHSQAAPAWQVEANSRSLLPQRQRLIIAGLWPHALRIGPGGSCHGTKAGARVTFGKNRLAQYLPCRPGPPRQSPIASRQMGPGHFHQHSPFGLHSAPKIFSAFTDALAWVQGIQWQLHYLDDFLFCCPPDSSACAAALQHTLPLLTYISEFEPEIIHNYP